MWCVKIYEGSGWYAEKNPPLEVIENLSKGRAFALGYWIGLKTLFRNRWVSIQPM